MNWKIIIAEIQEYGHLTQPQIAAKCECGQATVSDLANGKTEQPRHSLGVALLALLEQVKDSVKTQKAPVIPITDATKTEAQNITDINLDATDQERRERERREAERRERERRAAEGKGV